MKEIEFWDGEVIDQSVFADLRCQGQQKTCEKEDAEDKQGSELPNGTPGWRCRSGPDGSQPSRHGNQRQRYQQKADAGGDKRACNTEQKNGVTGDGETDSCREEKPFPPRGEADRRAAQTEPPDAHCDQAPNGQEKDRYSLLNKRRSHDFIQTMIIKDEILIMGVVNRKAKSGRIWKNYEETREKEGKRPRKKPSG